MPHFTAHQASLPSLAPSPKSTDYKSFILSWKITISLFQKPRSSKSLSLIISPAASVVSLHVGYVRPRALVLWAGSRTPRFSHCLKEPPGAALQTWCLLLFNPSGSSNSGFAVSSIHAPWPMPQPPPSLCPHIWGGMSTERKLAWENFKTHYAR